MPPLHSDFPTIVSLSTPPGSGALAVIRLSGSLAISIADGLFQGKSLPEQRSHSLHYGVLKFQEQLLDEVVIGLFKSPNSYTGEDVVEISCHASPYIIESILLACTTSGAQLAQPGEFTQRAFLHGKLDLSQAEAVADIIASENESQHRIAFQQMRGGYSDRIEAIRQELIDFAALLELELDFSEEDVEFANREKFFRLLDTAIQEIKQLIESFRLGNVIKKGIPVAIIGKPNVGKSTLLNALLQEEKAMVSAIPGTTRDFIEDTLQIEGITYRFIDTAGIRDTEDELEVQGIERGYEKMKQAQLILYLNDIHQPVADIVAHFRSLPISSEQQVFIVLTKSDEESNRCNAYDIEEAVATLTGKPTLEISAKTRHNLDKLQQQIHKLVTPATSTGNMVVSNMRHWTAFQEALENLILVKSGMEQGISSEFVSIDLRKALQALGTVTGKITNEDILSSVFSRFCIGK